MYLLPLTVAIFCFLEFVVFSLGFRVTSGETSSRGLIKTHFWFFLVYILISAGIEVYLKAGLPIWDWAVGGFVYLSLHYSMFMYLHAVPRKSVSVNLCVTISQLNGPTSQKLQAEYGHGKGMQFVVKDRVDSMVHMGMLKDVNGDLVLTKFGQILAWVHLIVLKVWSLRSNSGAENG